MKPLVPPVLKAPTCDYGYLQQVAQKVRSDIHVGESDKIDFTHLIRRFGELQTVSANACGACLCCCYG
jgi:hypothetical protein